MKLICPDCSSQMEGEVLPGELVDCPVCGHTFEARPAPEAPRVTVTKAPSKPAPQPPSPEPRLRPLARKAWLLHHLCGSRSGMKAEDEISKARGALAAGDAKQAVYHAETARDMVRRGCLTLLFVFCFIVFGLACLMFVAIKCNA